MKPGCSTLAALLLAPLAAFAQTPAAAPASARPGAISSLLGANLVKNPNFEAGDIIPEDWFIDAGADVLSYETEGGHAGRRCIKVTEAKKFLMQQEIPVLPGGTY